MIDGTILKLMQRSCPNYHVTARTAAAKNGGVCTCSRCQRHIRKIDILDRNPLLHCETLYNRLVALGLPVGHSRVDACATCDRAQDPQLKLPLEKGQAEKAKEAQ